MLAAPPLAAVLAAATFARLGLDADALAWALVQCLLVGLAAFDLATRRIPNVVTGPAAAAAIALRLAFERSALPEALIAGAAAMVFFLVFARLTRGLGMGDVKLAGLLGLLLGSAVLPALIVGTLAGGVSLSSSSYARGIGSAAVDRLRALPLPRRCGGDPRVQPTCSRLSRIRAAVQPR